MTHSTANPGLPLTTKASLKLLGAVVPEGVIVQCFHLGRYKVIK